ncbi:MAG TPA: ABC transporter ATP-binding protein [Steroidobacteraceae bacterium]|nr:ABC transporter ATP-binding protein [Steroidobacteraceae bacterium]
MSQSPLARLNDAHKRYGPVTALDGLDLQVNRGEMLALLGPNGAGKSTAISLLLGLQTPDRGSAELFGDAPQSLDARRRMGVMMQEVNLSPVLHPREMVAQVASYYPTPYRAGEVIERLSLEKIADRPYGKLSGGQKRQVQFGMAIAGRPELLFLDEPTVGLDVNAREALWQVLRDLIHEGVSIVLTTHYLEEAEALADRVAVVTHGKLVAGGSVDEIRAYVTRKNILCRTALAREQIAAWPEVQELREDSGVKHITTRDAEAVLRRLLAADAQVRDIEVKRAGLAEAFAEITSANPAAGNGAGNSR